MKNGVFSVLAAAASVVVSAPAMADPVTFGFSRITNNGVDVGSQLSVIVSDAGSGRVRFDFFNVGSTASSITDVYFDDSSPRSLDSPPPFFIFNGPGVDFSANANPGNLPGGNAVNFETTVGLSADSDPPVQHNGVNPGETLGIMLDLAGGATFEDLVANMTGSDVRIGLHVQGLPQDQSDSYVSGPILVPIPSGVTLGCTGLASLVGFAIVRRRRLN